jgi:hypothetical protein
MKLENKFPQTKINGEMNMWIVKPCGACQGRGIQVFGKLSKIINYANIDKQIYRGIAISLLYPHLQQEVSGNHTSKKDWIVQKYIENPLLIK